MHVIKHCKYWLALSLLCSGLAVAAEPETHWYDNETQCGEATVTVRSYCQLPDEVDENVVAPVNRNCGEQQLLIAQPGKRPTRLDLRKYEHGNDEFRVASSLRCVSAGSQRYLYVMFDNGGSCDTCETSALLSLDGRWLSRGGKWLAASRQERREIERARGSWLRMPAYAVRNM